MNGKGKSTVRVRFAIIGCGLMGREFASAAARWCHLDLDVPAPEIVAVADPDPSAVEWFKENVPSVRFAVLDYKELLANGEIDAFYCAIPHVLHEEVYCRIIRAGKHLMGEKPFGMDEAQNSRILQAVRENPDVFVRCSSQFPFFPACQSMVRWIGEKRFGRVIEVRAGFNHSSDLDLSKPINWKRKVEINGAYGCLGDLGIHTQHVPFRVGFKPDGVYAQLSKIVESRPDGKGGTARCETWDNALLMCDVPFDGYRFPMRLETKRMSPGSTDEWFIEVDGLLESARFSTNDPNAFHYTQNVGKEQAWCRLGVGYKPQFRTITGSIFEFGFTDAILQMWAAFVLELSGEKVTFGCVTPEETRLSHRLQTAALESMSSRGRIGIEPTTGGIVE